MRVIGTLTLSSALLASVGCERKTTVTKTPISETTTTTTKTPGSETKSTTTKIRVEDDRPSQEGKVSVRVNPQEGVKVDIKKDNTP